jgi:hypothetical protein
VIGLDVYFEGVVMKSYSTGRQRARRDLSEIEKPNSSRSETVHCAGPIRLSVVYALPGQKEAYFGLDPDEVDFNIVLE